MIQKNVVFHSHVCKDFNFIEKNQLSTEEQYTAKCFLAEATSYILKVGEMHSKNMIEQMKIIFARKISYEKNSKLHEKMKSYFFCKQQYNTV